MSRKDYVAIASVISSQYASAPSMDAKQAIARVTLSLADVLQADNPRFNRERFYAATRIPHYPFTTA